MNHEERLQLLERSFLGFVSLVTGELQKVATEYEVKAAQEMLASDLKQIRDNLK